METYLVNVFHTSTPLEDGFCELCGQDLPEQYTVAVMTGDHRQDSKLVFCSDECQEDFEARRN